MLKISGKKLIVLVILLAAIFLIFSFRQDIKSFWQNWQRARVLSKETATIKKENSAPAALPQEFNLAVPFTSQAPYGNWTMPYKEGCEEAAALMVNAFYQNKTITQESAKTEIDQMVAWELKNMSGHYDLNAKDMVKFIKGYYGYQNVTIIENPDIEQIKQEIFSGHPIILPAAGRLLDNPYYRQPGPLYHMLVIRGWTKNGMLITNDSGTKHGKNYLYKPEVLLNAAHDWNNGDVDNSKKVMIKITNQVSVEH